MNNFNTISKNSHLIDPEIEDEQLSQTGTSFQIEHKQAMNLLYNHLATGNFLITNPKFLTIETSVDFYGEEQETNISSIEENLLSDIENEIDDIFVRPRVVEEIEIKQDNIIFTNSTPKLFL